MAFSLPNGGIAQCSRLVADALRRLYARLKVAIAVIISPLSDLVKFLSRCFGLGDLEEGQSPAMLIALRGRSELSRCSFCLGS